MIFQLKSSNSEEFYNKIIYIYVTYNQLMNIFTN
jgi:hypothetical protein